MKAAPVIAALARYNDISQRLVHTGQHYDGNMSDVFFRELAIPQPDANLEVGSGSHAVQTAQIMLRFEKLALAQRPDLVLVYGDVNSTLAAALVCAKLGIPVGHVEAGLRSFDRTMPEEVNRLLTDQVADLLFTPSADANDNLAREGVRPERVYLVGNVMIDTLVRLLPEAQDRWEPLRREAQVPPQYALVTLHRPSNVDRPALLEHILTALCEISHDLPIIFPCHPRTRQRLDSLGTARCRARLRLTDPLGYIDFLALMSHATLVITDSGGVQEETTFLGIPCLTLRETTERPITVTLGTNTVVGTDMGRLQREVLHILSGHAKKGQIPPLWDGRAAERIAEIVSGFHAS